MTEETDDTITDKQLFRTLEWLEQNGRKAAQARAERVYLEEHLSYVRSTIAKEEIEAGNSAARADIWARASAAYKTALDGLKTAIENDEFYRWQRVRADAVVSAWQTMSANRRSLERL